MKKSFNTANDTIQTTITTTNGFFDGCLGILAGSSFATSSLSTTQKQYYYNLQYNSKDHISVTYGHIGGSGSAEQSATIEGTTQAIYKQFYNLTEINSTRLRDSVGWIINDVTQSDAYIVVAERLQMKDRVNPGTWTFKLSGSTTAGAANTIVLTDNSKTTSPSSAPFGDRYNIVSGSAGTAEGTSTVFGHFYPDAGLFVLSAAEMSSSLPGTSGYIQSGSGITAGSGLTPDTRVNDAADNAWKMTRALELGSVTLRSEERQYVYDYFCRAKANEYNLSQNVTFWSGSQSKIRHSDMITNPQTYISEVGLYDGGGKLVAVGKLSSALNKNFSSEAIVKVRLTY